MNFNNRLRMIAWVGSVIFLISGLAFAQAPTASITGTVQDSSQAAISGATITATSDETGATRAVQTGPDGHYVFLVLPIGVYDVKAEAASFQTQTQQKLTLTVGQQAVINFTMGVGSVSQEVNVTAEAPLVETTSGSLGGLVNEDKVADLPLNGRNFTDLTLLQTGIAVNAHPGGAQVTIGLDYSSNGAGVQSNYVTLDGASMKQGNGYNGASVIGTQLGVEGIREFLVVTNNFKAEYGMVVGSQTLIATKGGTNQFHGSAFDFLRNSALDARLFTDPLKIPPYRRNNFGGSFGGPIRKNKTFFFVTYEAIRSSQGVTSLFNTPTHEAHSGQLAVGGNGPTAQTFTTVPVAASVVPYIALYPDATTCVKPIDVFPYCTGGVGTYSSVFTTPTAEDFGQARVDHNFSDRDSFFARYTIDESSQTNSISSFTRWQQHLRGRSQFLTLAENHVFSPSLLNTFRVSYSRPIIDFEINSTDFSLGFIPGKQMGQLNPGSGILPLGPNSVPPFVVLQNLFTFSDDLSWSHGAHTFKFGALINHFSVVGVTSSSIRGLYTFPDLTNFLAGKPSQFSAATPGSIVDRDFKWLTYGFYGQDDWRVNARLTLNLGLRYEFNSTVNEVSGKGWSHRNILTDGPAQFNFSPAVFRNPSLRNFGPRFGFAWDVFGDSKTSVRGGFAYLYDVANIGSSATIAETGQPPYSGISTVLTTTPGLPGCTGTPCTGGVLQFPQTPVPVAAQGRTLREVDWHLPQTHQMQYNLTVERSLPSNMVFSVSYVGSRGFNVARMIDGNPTTPSGYLASGLPFWNAGATRVNPNFDQIELHTATSRSWYDALQATFQKRLSNGLQFQASYTWAHCLDTTQAQNTGESTGGNVQVMYPTRPELDKGNCDFDVPHTFILNALYRLPSPIASGWGHTVLSGWRVGSIVTLHSGQPFTVLDSGNASRSLNGNFSGFVADRPNLIPGCKVIQNKPTQWYNPACFTPQVQGTLGNEGRNMFFGPWLRNWDFSLAKDTPLHFLGEAGSLEFRAEFFNFLNHPGYASPSKTVLTVFTYTNTTVTTPGVAPTLTPLSTAGQLNNWIEASRQIQFALKLNF